MEEKLDDAQEHLHGTEHQEEQVQGPVINQQKMEAYFARMHEEQNFPLGLVAGVVAAVVAAILWAGLTLTTGYMVGYAAIGVGALVGIVIRIAGKGVTSKFAIVGAILA